MRLINTCHGLCVSAFFSAGKKPDHQRLTMSDDEIMKSAGLWEKDFSSGIQEELYKRNYQKTGRFGFLNQRRPAFLSVKYFIYSYS